MEGRHSSAVAIAHFAPMAGFTNSSELFLAWPGQRFSILNSIPVLYGHRR